MTATGTAAPRAPAPMRRAGLLSRITTTTDHKQIGLLYIATGFVFFLAGGILALLMRTELLTPEPDLVSRQVYNELFTMHGTIMVFLFLSPVGLGLATYLVPLHCGAPDMAFPRLNALSYWLYLFGGLVVVSGFLTMGGASGAGWTGYAPLSTRYTYPGPGVDLWAVGLILVGLSSIANAVNLITTVLTLRAPGMTMWRLPVFTWDMVVTSVLILFAFPPIALTLALIVSDRRLGTVFFDATAGGSAVLYQHLFWFFGHPEVYILVLPMFGVVTEILPVFSRKPVFGYTGLVLATLAIAGLSMLVWAHHMFTTGAVNTFWFSGASFLIAVPTGVKVFDWIGTMWRGRIRFAAPMWFAIAFIANFVLGGITGVMLASAPIDYMTQDTYFVVGHFHQVLVGGTIFGVFAAMHHWFPKFTGAMLRDRLGKIECAILFVGYNLTFLPMLFLGMRGMPRRIVEYDAAAGWTDLNRLSSLGSAVMGIAVVLFLVNVAVSLRHRVPAGDNPWDGHTLEWATSSPPPPHNFDSLPPIRSERPVFDQLVAAGKLVPAGSAGAARDDGGTP